MQIKINKFNLQIGLIIGVLQHSNYQKESNFKEPLKIDDFFSGLFQVGEFEKSTQSIERSEIGEINLKNRRSQLNAMKST